MPSQDGTPNITPDRRGKNVGAPTLMAQMMQSYLNMGQENRRFMRRLGVACWVFAALPQVAVIFLAREFSAFLWVFTFVVFFVGLCLIWPQAGAMVIEKLALPLMKLIPGKRPDRRKE